MGRRLKLQHRAGFLFGTGALVALAIACGEQGDPASPQSGNAPSGPITRVEAGARDATVTDAGDAGAREELATGTRIVTHPATLGGVTSDGYVLFVDLDSSQRPTAKVIALDGDAGTETMLVSSTGTGKDDLRYAIDGKVVFVWSDRGDRVSTLTMWSLATGVITVGPNVRPGRAAATADGNHVLYVRDVTDAGAKVVVGPSDGGTTMTIGTLNVEDTCWRGVDLATAGERLVARYCPAPDKTFLLKTFDPATKTTAELGTDVVSAAYGSSRLVWREGDGAIKSADGDGGGAVNLANAAQFGLPRDRSLVVYRTTAGDLASVSPDGGNAKSLGTGAIALGALSSRALLFATKQSDAGATDVKALRFDDGGVSTIVATPTSCVNCLFASFDDSASRVLVIDPLDVADEVGPVRIADLATGQTIATTGTRIITAAGYGDAGARFVFVDSKPDKSLVNGATYGIVTRGLTATDDARVIAKGTENLSIEISRNQAVFSFGGSGEHAGVWVAPLVP